MGRSSYEQALKNRERVVDAACALFRRFGVDNVSVAGVMKEAGMTAGGFYRHFPSKDALVREAFTRVFKQSSASWRQAAHVESGEKDSSEQDIREKGGIPAIVRRYFQKRPPEQTCPMLAFAPHVTSGAADVSCRNAYSQGAEALFAQFCDSMPAPATHKDGSPDAQRDARVLFAAMIGAKFLERAAGNAEWTAAVQEAVSDLAKAETQGRAA